MRSLALAAVIGVLTLAAPSTAQTLSAPSPVSSRIPPARPFPARRFRSPHEESAPLTRVSDASGAFTFERVPAADYDSRSPSPDSSDSPRDQRQTGQDDSVRHRPASGRRDRDCDGARQRSHGRHRARQRAVPAARCRMARPMPGAPPPLRPRRRRCGRIQDRSCRVRSRFQHRSLRSHRRQLRSAASPHDPLSTFSIDVDTASYANVRRFLNGGSLPPTDAVRIEELDQLLPIRLSASGQRRSRSRSRTEVAACPWNPAHRLALIGLQAKPLDMDTVDRRATSSS